eukprot:NODE_2582_length_1387_cov_27.454114_g2454_i0.p1 GENE.NODE_2582_length_1387_cov_27.454114_g2454_i0~~NODE_2582_length_1387_cov_27.454114_g2454_i0.p1  ORF type:complete len:428 (+),score=58.41 NODE_2582_length_1387_cov_27.454114_g2454_i0:56-1339(+)
MFCLVCLLAIVSAVLGKKLVGAGDWSTPAGASHHTSFYAPYLDNLRNIAGSEQDGWNIPPNKQWPRIQVCAKNYQKLHEWALPPRGANITLVFIKYPRTNILEPMFFALKNLSRHWGGFEVIRNRQTIGRTVDFRVDINFEEPNGMFIEVDPAGIQEEIQIRKNREGHGGKHIFTMCPYSAAWVNTIMGTCMRTPMWQAIPRKLVPPFIPLTERKYDIMYMSSLSKGGPVAVVLQDVFPLFKYRWISNKIYPQFKGKVRVTDYSKGIPRRLSVTADSRMALVVNCLFLAELERQAWSKRPLLQYHPAFDMFHRWRKEGRSGVPGGYLTAPQLKSRTFEAAACGALMLVYYDGMNVIEQYFERDIEFVYWHNVSDLETRIHDVLARPSVYETIARAAYEKVKEFYTEENWVRTLVMPLVAAAQRPAPA